jgi:hypothetical protein
MRSKTQGGLAQTLPLNVCDAPKAQVGQIALPAQACPFGTSQTLYFGVCAILRQPTWSELESAFCGNKARMFMKTKERLRNQPPLVPP